MQGLTGSTFAIAVGFALVLGVLSALLSGGVCDRGRHGRGILARDAVARAVDDDELAVRQLGGQPLARAPRNFASRSPARTVTGIVSSPSRSHSGSIAPGAEAAQRGGEAAGSLRSDVGAPARRAPAAASPANSGCAVQRVGERLDRPRLDLVGERLVGRAARARARAGSSMPAVGRDEHEPLDALGRGERDAAARSGRPSSSRRA